ncbi:MAG: hypothetical protein JXB03_06175 [Spirochaetales bacterium]|nr:hypothetical protein [Spirochaetales bacterium]
MKHSWRLIYFIPWLFISVCAYGQIFQAQLFSSLHFEEPADIRLTLKEFILSSAYIARNAPHRILYSDRIARDTEFRVIETDGFFYQVIVPEYAGIFPLYSKGSYIIKRDKENGAYIQAKIFLKSEASCFARISPQQDRSVLEVFIYDRKVGDEIVLPVVFEDLLFMPFNEVVSLTENKIPWDIVWPDIDPSHSLVRDMADKISLHLPVLKDEDDGAMDKDGNFVYIESGERSQTGGFNCSGFAKWVVDGVSRNRDTGVLDIEELKQKHTAERGSSFSAVYEEDRDPYFGLDWTRNLASQVSGRGYEDSDARNVPYHRYTEDVGFKVGELESVMYQLSVDTPGRFYLGSVNMDYGADPVLRQHVHVVVLFPYLDSQGELVVRVMERNRETSLKSLETRYPDGFIHLVHIDAAEDYTPFDIVTRLE